jgi:hypothetical protein
LCFSLNAKAIRFSSGVGWEPNGSHEHILRAEPPYRLQ